MTNRSVLRLALVGNPNSGKTTLFNALTGARQKVANYPGVTVERREGRIVREGHPDIVVLDLPGTYSLCAHSEDEKVACEAVLIEHPDVVVAVVDATNLTRNLYLVIQLLELGVRLVVALNMVDAAQAQGGRVDAAVLERNLGVPVVPTIGPRRIGITELIQRVEELARTPKPIPLQLDYGLEAEKHIEALTRKLESEGKGVWNSPERWVALQLLGRDEATLSALSERSAHAPAIIEALEQSAAALQRETGADVDTLLIGGRYRLAEKMAMAVIHRGEGTIPPFTDRLDSVLTHRFLGLPIFLVILWAIFQITFYFGQFPMDWIDTGFSWLGERVGGMLPPGIWSSLIGEALFGGVAAVLVFLPQILLLFFCIGLLEDSGYMARAAFLIDRLMRRLGLHGKSLIPLLLGFGCNIPGIMATRTLDNPRDRLVTILVSPLMNCSARLTVHTLLAAAFFSPRAAGQALFSIYLLGGLLAIGSALVFRRTLFRGVSSPFLMEMPPYRLPNPQSIGLQMWDRAGKYLKKAGTILLAFSVLIWVATHYPRADSALYSEDGRPTADAIRHSAAGRFGEWLAPVLRPIGLDNWRIAVALVAGTAAKEVIIATLGTVYSAEEVAEVSAASSTDANVGAEPEKSTALRRQLAADPTLNPLRGYVLMVFVLLYLPCITTMVIVRRETNTWRWPVFMLVYMTSLAYIFSLAAYHGGRWLGFGI
jgi:ferrous iron transport protein B